MTKRILLSVAASALLSTSIFAGDIITDKGHATISEESYMQNGMDIIDFRSLRYTATVERTLTQPNGSTVVVNSISDPLIEIDITKIEFAYHVNAIGALVPGFDEKGKGMTPVQILPFVNGENDLVKTLLEDDYFGGSVLQDVDGNSAAIPFSQINVENAGTVFYAQYDGSSFDEVKNGHQYALLSDNNISMPFKYPRDNAFIGARLFSVTIDDSFIDDATYAPTTNFVPQFKVSCVRKFDGLINFENDRISFVNPAHGERLGAASTESGNAGAFDPAVTSNDSLINNDRMVFEIENARTNANDSTRWMGGHLSEFRFNASNDDNAFETAAEWTITADKFAAATVDGVDTLDAPSNTYTVAGSTPFVEHNPADRAPGIEFDDVTDIFTITHEDEAIAAGTTTYEVNFKKMATATPIRPVAFESVSIDLEGGIAADSYKDRAAADRMLVMSVGGNQPINYVHDLTAAGSHFVINDVDDNTTVITPQVEGSATMGQDIGEWMDHAFIAQIPGATQTAATQTKLFIVNRSCAPVTPKFRLIKDGVVTEVNGAEIAVDSQQKTTLASIVPADGQYAVEIIIPGVAEDFYVYAQAQGVVDKTITKDLPVYTTSNRD